MLLSAIIQWEKLVIQFHVIMIKIKTEMFSHQVDDVNDVIMSLQQ